MKQRNDKTNGQEKVVCGVVMPISAIDGYSDSHWSEVLQILHDAIKKAGFEAKLVSNADEVGLIHKRIIENLHDNPIVVCDVSGKNPNVMFELGLRLAFDKPTIIIKDDKTSYSFDTSPIEHLEYPRDLRFQKVLEFKQKLSDKIKATHQKSISDSTYSTFLKNFGDFILAQPTAIQIYRTADEAYTEACSVIDRIDATVDGEKCLFLCPLHGTLSDNMHPALLSASGSTTEFHKRFDETLEKCIKSSGKNRWNVKYLYNVPTIDRLKMIRGHIKRDAEAFEVRTLCMPQLIPQLSPLIIGDKDIFLGAIDSRNFRIDSAIHLVSIDAVRFFERYISSLWDSRLVYRLRSVLGINRAEVERLSNDLVSLLDVPELEQAHLRNIAIGKTQGYVGGHELRTILRNLRSLGLVHNLRNHTISELTDSSHCDLAEIIELTEYGRLYAKRFNQRSKPTEER